MSKAEKHGNYSEFVEKFKPKLTTDDCYTPPLVYEAVAKYVSDEYGVHPDNMLRPFFPGGDYKSFHYPAGCMVVDNPPFSMLGEIIDHYIEKGVKFFLFAPALTAFNYTIRPNVTAVISNSKIVYENGAEVITAFLTNLTPDIAAETAPRLNKLVADAVKAISDSKVKKMPRYEYPTNLITAAKLKAAAHCKIRVERCKSHHLRALDAQRQQKKAVYGCGFLVPDDVAQAVDLAISTKPVKVREYDVTQSWQLSDRENEIIKSFK